MSRKKPRSLPKKPKAEPADAWKISLGLGILAAMAIIAGINYHGLTYDEPIYAGFGARSAQWAADFFTSIFDGTFRQHISTAAINKAWFSTIDMQPPLVQVLSGLSHILLGEHLGGLLAPRLPSALLFALAVGTLFWLTEKAFNREAAFFAAIGLILLPNFFGHAHFTSLDVPVSALILLTAAAFYAASEERSWNLALLAGLFMGLALLTKLNAAFLIGILLIWAAVFHPPMILRGAIAFFIVSPIIFFIGWPWLWHDTPAHLKGYLFFHLQHYPVLVYYLGELHEYAPWHYPFVMTAVTTPAVFLLLMLIGIIHGASGRSAYEKKKVNSSFAAGRWLLIICALGYLIPSAMPFAPKYNGVRLFLPAFPFLMGLAGGGLAFLHGTLLRLLGRIGSLARIERFRGKLAFVLILGLLLPAVVGLSRVYPYEQAYYNALVGGPAGAQKRGFETTYWGSVYLSALPALNANSESARILITPQGVTSLLEAYQRGSALKRDLQWVTPPPPKEQKPGWTRKALAGVDQVVFQCAQSEFDELAWKLYKEGRPEPTSGYLEDKVPLLLIFSGEEARRVFSSGKGG
jgi:4-amino-4-deoxy-L-arabinose transferase-like glycosyltransferase